MKLNAGLVGTRLKDYQTSVSWRETTNYAAAVQDDNPRYFDDRGSGGNRIPPHVCSGRYLACFEPVGHLH